MTVITSLEGQTKLPRYFASCWEMLERTKSGRMDIVLPDGRRFRHEGGEPGPVGEIVVHDETVFARLVREGDLGFTDAYLEGQWSTPDLMALYDLINKEGDSLIQQQKGLALLRAYEKLRFWMQRNTKGQAKKNIQAHYDLGNSFYSLWLDDTMTYSAGIFETGQESLEAAQMAKYASIVDRMEVSPGEHILEIGCGWGGFAEYAAKERGLRVTCLTLSEEQRNYAVERMAREGLSDRVEIKLQDYRDETGIYDGIASIEMFEAVGQRYWPSYFATLRDRLRPGRQASLQIITVPDRRWEIYSGSVDFIQKYIFPGGFLAAPFRLTEEIGRAGLIEGSSISIAKGYSLTLRRWFDRFNERWADVAAQGFDERFRRMWNTYLTSCAGAFEYGNCDVIQMIVRKPG
ncbi:SAM-dependent methyltransferase [Jannaschia seohaensis]|uniref:Cyclopropane-fatty-acyl-phospholipid synthase n=1 Tax=Jannaschia seohaensis TaxID=475081 RepID=A0A2Y9AMM4_9RHOB|nr:cyclopropane-fatty-acyl-phospholipid synthase family protein [Jannaschia seohaensis]PWJ20522.1 cyclopropane-fatty-acyl-phospholipid synthase [Jannaschia seohaensis]SSA44618.1 cyclopropane-fatty-acyl-phospholipid synthase [Jannaschia seohaensis]